MILPFLGCSARRDQPIRPHESDLIDSRGDGVWQMPACRNIENGDVIFVKKAGKDYSLRTAHLSPPDWRPRNDLGPVFTTS